MLTHYLVKPIKNIIFVCILLVLLFTTVAEAAKADWEFDFQGQATTLECTLYEDPLSGINDKVAGICQKIDNEINNSGAFHSSDPIVQAALNILIAGGQMLLEGVVTGTMPSGDAIGAVIIGTLGSSFDLGNFATCEMSYPDIYDTSRSPLAELCQHYSHVALNSLLVWINNSVDASGVFTGTETNRKLIKTDDKKYRDITGKKLYRDNGGYVLNETKLDPQGHTAQIVNNDDIPSLVLSDMALKVTSPPTSDPSAVKLPLTKADSIDDVDTAVQNLARLHTDFNGFTNRLAYNLGVVYVKKIITPEHGDPCSTTLKEYRNKELEVSADYFKSKESGINGIREAIANEARARMASELLLMTTEKGFIFDPSESRANYLADEYKIPFRYAALVQQEKLKKIQYEISLDAIRKKELLELAIEEAQVISRIFRDDVAKCEVDDLLSAVDTTVSYSGGGGGGGGGGGIPGISIPSFP